jgi:hypothetical protein
VVLLRDGRVLIIGGEVDKFSGKYRATAELFDPTTGKFQLTGSMAAARQNYAAVLLQDGRVAVLGGVRQVEIYDPATGQFSPHGELPANTVGGVYGATAHLLSNGRVLLVGGTTAAVQLYDPETSQTTRLGNLSRPRPFAASVSLLDGRILVAGGDVGGSVVLRTSELIDPATGTISPGPTFPAAAAGRIVPGTALLQDGRVLIAGGINPSGFIATALVYIP